MGTTVEKFNYAFGTKDLLKTEINKINNVLDDNSTFRSYPQELFNGYLDILNNGTDTLWNNLEKVSASGEEATLENVETAPMKIDLKGNTSQETTTGKNLFNKDNEQKVIINPTTGTERYGIIIEAPNKKVSFSGTWLSDNNLAYKLINGETYGSYVSFNSPITIDVQDKILFYNGTENQKLSVIVDKIQIEIGTITSYEPYTGGQPSPNPNYPQEVKVVTGENVVSVSGKNLFDKDNDVTLKIQATFTGTEDNEFTTSTSNIRTLIITKVPSNSEITISINNDNYIQSRYFISQLKTPTIEAGKNEKWYTGNSTIVTTDKTNYLGIVLEIKNNGTIVYSTQEAIDEMKLQIEEGSTATPYVPYSKTDYPINLGDIELCKINTYKDYFHKDNGKWYVHKEIGKVVLDGTQTISSYNTSSTNTTRVSYHNLVTNMVGVVTLLCNMLPQKNNWNNDTEGISYNAQNRDIWFRISKSTIGTTQTETNSFLATNNMIIYYVLATPTEEEITNTTLIEQLEAISKAKSVKDKTYITQTNEELPFILDVEAIKKYEVN